MEDVDVFLDRHLTITEDRQQRRLSASVQAEETVATSAIELWKEIKLYQKFKVPQFTAMYQASYPEVAPRQRML